MIFLVAGINLLIIFFLCFFVWKKQQENLRGFFLPALIFKLTAGVVLGLIYKYYYRGGDTYIFFRDATKLSDLFRANPQEYFSFLWSGDGSFPIWSALSEIQPRSLFFTKIVSVLNVITNDNYWITAAYLSLISFVASWYLFRKIVDLLPQSTLTAALSFLFFPTVVFWSSGLIKESLAMASVFFLSGFFLLLINKSKSSVMEWILIPGSVWLLWMLKYYWAVIFFPAAITTLVFDHFILSRVSSRFSIQILTWSVLFAVICLCAMALHPNFYPEYFLHVIVDNNQALNSLSESQNLVHFYNLHPQWTSIIINSPWALFSGILRPFFFEIDTVIGFLYSFENLIILILIVTSILNIAKIPSSPSRLIVFAIIVYSIGLCTFLTLSTPNFGTLARYRIGFLPFLIFILAYRNPLIEKVLLKIKPH